MLRGGDSTQRQGPPLLQWSANPRYKGGRRHPGDFMTEEVTLESLQAQVLAMAEKQEQMETEKIAMQQELDATKNSLKEARELNAKLWRQGVAPETRIMDEVHEEPETIEQFMDSFIKPGVERLKKIYGDDNVADFNGCDVE